MIIKRTELYDLISKLCNGEYAIGLHGVDYDRLDELVGIDHTKALDDILNEGLKIFHARSINGTVNFFGRIDIEEEKEKVIEGLNTYRFGSNEDYIVIAVPTILKTEKGDKLFLGSPNLNTIYKEHLDSRGGEKSTLLEEHIVNKDNVVEPQYILGRFKVLSNGNIDFYINKRHISFNKGFIDQETYDMISRIVRSEFKFISRVLNMNIDPYLLEKIDYVDSKMILSLVNLLEKEKRIIREYSLYETLRQLANEKNLTKRINDSRIDEKLFDKPIYKDKMVMYLKRGIYYESSDSYYVEINYPTDESKKTNLQIEISRLMRNYGPKSKWAYENHDCVVPYLIDKEGIFTIENSEADAIGGTNIPRLLLKETIKNFVEKNNCKIICGDLVMEDTFKEEVYDSMIKQLDEKRNNRKF